MPFVSECPSCGQKLKVPDELAGKKVRCSKCAGTFLAEAVTEHAPAAPPPPRRRQEEEPEERYEDEDRPARRSRRDDGGGSPGRGGMLLTFGIISIAMAILSLTSLFVCNMFLPIFGTVGGVLFVLLGLVFGIMAWTMGSGDLKQIRAGRIDRAAEGSTKGGYICGIIGTILNVLQIVCSCVLIVIGIAFGLAFIGMAGNAAARQQQNQPFGPGPVRRTFNLPLPKLSHYMPSKIAMPSP